MITKDIKMENTIVINGVTYVRQDQVKVKESRSYIDLTIEEIISHFDFDKVQKVMEFLDWKWPMTENGVPSIDEMKEVATGLLKTCYNISQKAKVGYETGTGGFVARAYYNVEYDRIWLKLTFALRQWSNDYNPAFEEWKI